MLHESSGQEGSGQVSRNKIMVVEDEFIVARDLQSLLEGLNYEVTSLNSTGEEAVRAALAERPDLVLMDIVLAGKMDGVQAAEAIRAQTGIPVVFITAFADKETTGRAKITEPLAYILKPFERRELEVTIELALYKARMDAKLRESQERYRTLVENTHEGILVIQDGANRYCNEPMLAISGRTEDELARVALLDLVHPDDCDAVEKRLSPWLQGGSAERPDDFRLLTPEGLVRWVEVNLGHINWQGRPAVLVFVSDITERKRLEAQMLLSQKLQSLGIVAGGVAHDYNNIMMSIMGSCEMAMEDADKNSAVYVELEQIRELAERAVELTRKMLEFTGKTWLPAKDVDLNLIIREIETIAKAPLPPKSRLVLELAPALPFVLGDSLQLQQVVLSLVGNAAEALAAEATGRVTVRTKAARCDREFLQASYVYESQEPGDYVMLEVSDNGAGISPGDRDRLFDPFFTTKFPGRGLGLAAVLGIVRSMKGAIQLESEPGKGSSFRLYLPAAPGRRV